MKFEVDGIFYVTTSLKTAYGRPIALTGRWLEGTYVRKGDSIWVTTPGGKVEGEVIAVPIDIPESFIVDSRLESCLAIGTIIES